MSMIGMKWKMNNLQDLMNHTHRLNTFLIFIIIVFLQIELVFISFYS